MEKNINFFPLSLTHPLTIENDFEEVNWRKLDWKTITFPWNTIILTSNVKGTAVLLASGPQCYWELSLDITLWEGVMSLEHEN